MFEACTKQTLESFNQGLKEAYQFGWSSMSNHDILLGLLVVHKVQNRFIFVLHSHGITPTTLRSVILKTVPPENLGRAKVPLDQITFSQEIQDLLNESYIIANDFEQKYIGLEHLILGLIDESQNSSFAYKIIEEILDSREYIININMLRLSIIRAMGFEDGDIQYQFRESDSNDKDYEPRSKIKESRYKVNITKANSDALKAYTLNISKQSNRGLFDPIIGRVEEVKHIVNILLRFRKSNPLLLGEPGVGKTAVLEGLTFALRNDYVPKRLSEYEFLELDLTAMLAGSKYKGEFEERFKTLIDAFKNFDTLVLVIDEIHTLMGAGLTEGGGSDAAGILKPSISRGELKCIGATTNSEYRKLFQKDVGFDRLFQTVTIPEPSKEETIRILEGVRTRYEKHHHLKIQPEAIVAAVNLSSEFINDRFLPDKALDLIDEGCSRARMFGVSIPNLSEPFRQEFQQTLLMKEWAIEEQDFEKALLYLSFEAELRAIGSLYLEDFLESKDHTALLVMLKPDLIADIVTAWTGIPMVKTNQSDEESNKYVNMEGKLQERVIGQTVAITAIAKAVRRARVGLKSPNRPIASFIFAGPTGVGKTELAKTLASFFFGSDDSMVRLDMSEYMERHNVSKLIGSPPGYVGYEEGGFLTEKIRTKPYSVVLFDEVEKAHPDVFNLLLQILEDGRLSDSQSRVIDFKNTFIILTSNIGSSAIQQETQELANLGEINEDIRYSRLVNVVNTELKQHFRPELLNRLDEIIVFQQLTLKEVGQIADILLVQLVNRVLKKFTYLIKIENPVKEKLTIDGFDPLYGARPLRRVIMNSVENKLASLFLENSYPQGSTLRMYLDDENEISIETCEEKILEKEEIKIEEISELEELDYFEIQREYNKVVDKFSQDLKEYLSIQKAGRTPPGRSFFAMGNIKSVTDIFRLSEGLKNKTIMHSDYLYIKAKDMTIDEFEAYRNFKQIAFERQEREQTEDNNRIKRKNY
jgi:ATP-dependent Clp protease ATP-binding subunit ClpC